MHNAKVNSSHRLQQVLECLRTAGAAGVTTRALMMFGTGTCAPGTVVSELRQCGYVIECIQEGRGRFRYRLVERADAAAMFSHDVLVKAYDAGVRLKNP